MPEWLSMLVPWLAVMLSFGMFLVNLKGMRQKAEDKAIMVLEHTMEQRLAGRADEITRLQMQVSRLEVQQQEEHANCQRRLNELQTLLTDAQQDRDRLREQVMNLMVELRESHRRPPV